MRGFFQGLGTMMPSATSQILEQIVNAIVSVWAAYVSGRRGSQSSALLDNKENYAAALRCRGRYPFAMGAVTALLFCTFVLVVYRPFKKRLKKERKSNVDSYGSIMKVLIATIVPGAAQQYYLQLQCAD